MRKATTVISLLVLLGWISPPTGATGATGTEPPAPPSPDRPSSAAPHLPWREAGWTPEEAAAHLLNRFAYGPRPGEVEEVVRMGLDRWFAAQLAADQPDPELAQRLAALPTLRMSTAQILAEYPPAALLLRQARAQGLLPARGSAQEDARETMSDAMPGPASAPPAQASEQRKSVLRMLREHGGEPERRLLEDQMAQKLLRAVTARNQLTEVMTDFWFNHFNVSFTKPQVRPFLISYERDAIRPFALGRFRDLLGATAHHPAMLAYLDNLRSSAPEGAVTKMAVELERTPLGRGRGGFTGRGGAGAFGGRGAESGAGDGLGGFGRRGMLMRRGGLAQRRMEAGAPDSPGGSPGAPPAAGQQRSVGLNENYARELMELHTLGVDGGYDQKDVVEVARAFTGWSVMPIGERREGVERRLSRARAAGGLGFQESGDFLFRADQHDAGSKTVLGVRLPSGRGIEDGEQVLDLLAAHRSTARHLATELAARFVADAPPPALVDRLTAEYLRTNGDVRRLLTTIAESPELWSRANRAAKIKSPLELVASAVRATGGGVREAGGLVRWVVRLGEPLYANPVPTGFADRGSAWINSGTLLARMNFGLDLAAGKIAGVTPGEPGEPGAISLTAAPAAGASGACRAEDLRRCATALLPGRDLTATLELLAAAQKAPAPGPSAYDFASLTAGQKLVGVLLGSPEFQRR